MRLIESTTAVHSRVRKTPTETLGFVPTMGALHAGHEALIRRASEEADRVVVSIFVNPIQFGPNEDLSRYPRTLEADLARCEALGVDTVWTPTVETLYPHGTQDLTTVQPPASLLNLACGVSRPGHFEGVATVVMKLFQVVQPDLAVFGEKDAQQLAVIRRMVADLNLPVRIVAHPTVREDDGLARSSRNRYLITPEDRACALVLPKTLQAVASALTTPGQPLAPVLAAAQAETLDSLPPEQQARVSWDYLLAVSDDRFTPLETFAPGNTRLLGALKVRDLVRLIDTQFVP